MRGWRKQRDEQPQPAAAEVQPEQAVYSQRVVTEDPKLSAEDLLAIANRTMLGFEWRLKDEKLVYRIAVEPDIDMGIVNQTSRDVIADYPSASFEEIEPALAMAQYTIALTRSRHAN